MPRRTPGQHRLAVLVAVLAMVVATQTVLAPAAFAQGFVPISGAGSADSFQALNQWQRDVDKLFDIKVNFSPSGSSDGRRQFSNGTVDFAVSEIEYLTDGGVVEPPPGRAFGYLPIVADRLSFMYNLKIDGKRVTNLRLSGENLAKIFTQQITTWSDPAIQADNPGLTLPERRIVPVVRSDGAGTTAQFTRYLASQHPASWDDYCRRAGRTVTPCGITSFYPLTGGIEAKSGLIGVAGFVAQTSSEGAITYVEFSAARNTNFPVVKVLNAANYYVEPKAANVGVALLKARLNPDLTQDLSQVYVDPDPRSYPLASYSYMIIPKDTTQNFTTEKGRTLSEFAYYSLCEGPQQADAVGYAPLPVNLVRAAVDQVGQIPGSTRKLSPTDLQKCNNPTFSPDGTDLLARNAPQPEPCDRKGAPTQCTTGTGGAAATATLTTSPASPVAAGTAVTFNATVTPSTAAGSVQFTDGSTNIGNPITVTNGTASTTTTLTPGTHSLTAKFTPTDPNAFNPTTSNTVTFVVNAPAGAKATTTRLRVFPNRAFARNDLLIRRAGQC